MLDSPATIVNKECNMSMSYFEFKPISERGKVSVVAPSGSFDKRHFNAGVNYLKHAQVNPVWGQEIFEKHFYNAGTADIRAKSFLSAFKDGETELVWAARGGFGAMHLLPELDKHIDVIKQNGKIFVGFSDITILQNYLVEKCGLIAVHGPNITTINQVDKLSQQQCVKLIKGEDDAFTIHNRHIFTAQSGAARGVIRGGNLSSLCSLIGTPWEPEFNDAILFLEETGEVPYRVDRMLTQMRYAGKFKNIKGLIIGGFSYKDKTKNVNVNVANQTAYELAQYKGRSPRQNIDARMIVEKMGIGKDIPVIANFPAGHGRHNMSFMLGALATLDADNKSLSYITG